MSGVGEAKLTPREAMQSKRLTIILLIVGAFFGAEFTAGVIAKSSVLKTDALHLLMDCVALAASLIAMRLSVRKPTERFTFGLRRAEPVAALFNAVLVLLATIEIVRDAFESLGAGMTPNAHIMLPVSAVALVVNGMCAWLLHGAMGHEGHDHGNGHAHAQRHDQGHDQDHDQGHGHAHGHGEGEACSHEHGSKKAPASEQELNLRGVWLHLMGDALGSLTALAAAIVIWFKGPRQVDLLASLVVATIIAVGALRLIRDALTVLLEAAPKRLPTAQLRTALAAHPGVEAVTALHVWTLGGGHHVVMAHVRAKGGDVTVGSSAATDLKRAFGLQYVTIQVDADASHADHDS